MCWSVPKTAELPRRHRTKNPNESSNESQKPKKSPQNTPTPTLIKPLHLNRPPPLVKPNTCNTIRNKGHLFTFYQTYQTLCIGVPSVVQLSECLKFFYKMMLLIVSIRKNIILTKLQLKYFHTVKTFTGSR